MASKLKDPGESRIFTFDWADHLGTTVTISSQTTTAETGLTVTSSAIGSGNQVVNVKLTGGTTGEDYVVTNTIVTSTAETLVAKGTVAIRPRAV